MGRTLVGLHIHILLFYKRCSSLVDEVAFHTPQIDCHAHMYTSTNECVCVHVHIRLYGLTPSTCMHALRARVLRNVQ